MRILMVLAVLLAGGTGFAFADGDNVYNIKDRYSYREFARLDRFKVEGLNNRFQLRKKAPSIEGFSDAMAEHVTSMLVHDFRSMQRLNRDLATITRQEDREKRIQIEIDRIEKFRKTLGASLSFQADGGNHRPSEHNPAFWDELGRDTDAKYYLHGLKTWLDYPWEGTRK